jgi:uncharacterized protein YdeI (YjbR/CyaY-like superfamily)
MNGVDVADRIHPYSADDWGFWLRSVGERTEGVWLILWRRGSGRRIICTDDALLEATAVGWEGGESRRLDDDRSMVWFAPRCPVTAWTQADRERVARLESEGRMAPAGRRVVEQAKASGIWA